MNITDPTVELYTTLVTQNQANLIPFSFVAEAGFVDSSVIGFTLEPSDGSNIAGFTTNEIIKSLFSNSSSIVASNVYVPEAENATIRHTPYIYADIIAGSASGIKEVSLRTQSPIYAYEKPEYVFNTPKFTWINEANVSAIAAGNVWVSTTDKTVNRIAYSNVYASNVYTTNTLSESFRLYFKDDAMFASGYDSLIRYSVNEYWDSGIDIYPTQEIANPDEELISWANSVLTISTAAYTGKLVLREATSLLKLGEMTGFDAPSKVVYSPYHNCFLVAGTGFIWKWNLTENKQAVYGAKDYTIVDIDCSPAGRVCVLLHGFNHDIIVLLDNDLFKILAQTEVENGYVKFCKYCSGDLFYALVENSKETQASTSYAQTSYVLDAVLKTITAYSSSVPQTKTVDSHVVVQQSDNVTLTSPVGGESIVLGSTYAIKWTSKNNIADKVSLELYLANSKVSVISDVTGNTGVFDWNVPVTLMPSVDYRIKLIYLTASVIQDSVLSPATFSIKAKTAGENLSQVNDNTAGIIYSRYNNVVVIILRNGMVGIFSMKDYSFAGMFDSGVRNILSIAANDRTFKPFTQNDKVRMFVGSAPYLNDKWDSGVVATNCCSMYYGGGDNLLPGGEYFINVQIYSAGNGWSEVQTRPFVMPN